MEKTYHTNTYKKGEVTIISDKADFKTRSIVRNKEGIPTITTDIILHVYIPNKSFKYMKQKLTELKNR